MNASVADAVVAELPIDLLHLARYTLGSRELEQELLSLFSDSAATYVSQMLEADSDDAWRQAAHTLKGSARGVGAFDVADEAAYLEAAARPLTSAEAKIALTELEKRIDAARAFIETL